jgi:hypothetical protein
MGKAAPTGVLKVTRLGWNATDALGAEVGHDCQSSRSSTPSAEARSAPDASSLVLLPSSRHGPLQICYTLRPPCSTIQQLCAALPTDGPAARSCRFAFFSKPGVPEGSCCLTGSTRLPALPPPPPSPPAQALPPPPTPAAGTTLRVTLSRGGGQAAGHRLLRERHAALGTQQTGFSAADCQQLVSLLSAHLRAVRPAPGWSAPFRCAVPLARGPGSTKSRALGISPNS